MTGITNYIKDCFRIYLYQRINSCYEQLQENDIYSTILVKTRDSIALSLILFVLDLKFGVSETVNKRI